jgi:hypothetical protein
MRQSRWFLHRQRSGATHKFSILKFSNNRKGALPGKVLLKLSRVLVVGTTARYPLDTIGLVGHETYHDC